MMFFVALIEIPLMLIALLIVKVYKAAEQAVGAKQSKPMPKDKAKELSDEQRLQIVNSILETALLVNDTALDTLLNEGEALYPALEACKIKAKDFDLQYGSKVWLKAWIRALEAFFDCKSEYVSDGVFHVYGKEA